MSERPEWRAVPVEEAIDWLAGAGLLTERQAEAYVLREIELEPRPATAERMGISVNTLDSRLSEARRKVDSAMATIDAIEELRHRPIPESCEECGDALGGRLSTNDAGEPICLPCAGVDE